MSPRTAIAVADEMGLDEGSLNQLFRDARTLDFDEACRID